MAVHGCNRSGIRQVLLHIFMLLIPLSATHGRSSLATARRQHHHVNHSSVAVAREGRGDRTVLSDDSAERDLLIGAGISLGAGLPISTAHRHRSHKHVHLDFPEEEILAEELTAGGGSPDQPAHLSSDDIITVEFHSPAPDTSMISDLHPWMKPPKPQQQKAGDPTAWTLSDFYEYLSPDDDLSALDTTPNPEPSPSPPPDMEDENPLLVGSPVVPDNTEANSNAQPTQPPPVVLVGQGSGMEEREGPEGCSLGFVRSEMGTCVSQCDSQPNFCKNGGVCTAVAGVGAFCRCNVQDYIWNKGLRCDWVITEFQVLCVVVGVASLMLLLLLMIIVFFAKRLHLLKKENKRLRKRSSKYRPHSEPQTDGFSVSTVTDGSHPNDDPSKLEDPVKSPPTVEEDNLNIRNSHSPKHENNRPSSVVDHTLNNTDEASEDGVTIGLQLLLPKDAKLRPEASPPLHYNVFLYKLPGNGDSTQNGNSTSTRLSPTTPNSNSTRPSPTTPNSASTRPSPTIPNSASTRPSPTTPNSASTRPSPTTPNSNSTRSSLTTPNSASTRPSHVTFNQAGPHAHHTSSKSHRRNSSPNRYPSPSRPPLCGHHRSLHCPAPSSSPPSSPPLRKVRGRSGTPFANNAPSSQTFLHPSPSSPHLTQPPSPSNAKYSPVSTRSLPPLSYAL